MTVLKNGLYNKKDKNRNLFLFFKNRNLFLKINFRKLILIS